MSFYILLRYSHHRGKIKINTDESWFKISESAEETKVTLETHYLENLGRNPLSNTKKEQTNRNKSINSLIGIYDNGINNNIIKLLFSVAFSVSVPERGLSYPKFQPPYAFPHFFSYIKIFT